MVLRGGGRFASGVALPLRARRGKGDHLTHQITALYNPRQQHWVRHFRLVGARSEPLTVAGRATERLLRLNDQRRIDERLMLISLGHYPPG